MFTVGLSCRSNRNIKESLMSISERKKRSLDGTDAPPQIYSAEVTAKFFPKEDDSPTRSMTPLKPPTSSTREMLANFVIS